MGRDENKVVSEKAEMKIDLPKLTTVILSYLHNIGRQ